MITSAAPNGLQASNWSARRCSGLMRRFREGMPASVAIYTTCGGNAPSVMAGQVNEVRGLVSC